MSRTLRTKFGVALTTAAVVLVAGAGLVGGQADAAVRSSGSAAATPKLSAIGNKKGLTITGPRKFRAGRVALSLESANAPSEIEVASFKKGYNFAEFASDVKLFSASEGASGSTRAGILALDRAAAHSTLYGGLAADPGTSVAGTVVLPHAGTYYAWNDLQVPKQPVKLTVTGPEVTRSSPHPTATVTALTDERFGGAVTLPAAGTITFRNESTTSPHFLSLQHVKNGTTRAQVLASFSTGDTSYALGDDANTDAVSPGKAMTLTYHVPKGEYVEVCFFPDLKTGIPHALMGMVRIVHLK
jgi:hypothetical protein